MSTVSSFLIVKYNPDGDTLWTKQFKFSDIDRGWGVAVDDKDNIIAVGITRADTTAPAEMRVIRCNPDGEIINTWLYNMKNIMITGKAVAVDKNNDIVVAGNKNTDFGNYITVKFDSAGTVKWIREYNNGYRETVYDIALDSMNNIIVSGQSDNNMNYDWCTIKYSPEGDTLWIRRYDIGTDDLASSVACDNEDNIIVAGKLGQGLTKYASVVKYSSYGDTLWMEQYLRDSLDGVFNFDDLTIDDENNLHLTGYYSNWSIDYGLDYFIVKYSKDGDTLWTKKYDKGYDEPSSITIDNKNNIIITGTTSDNPNWGYYDLWTIKIKNDIVGIEDINYPYPNKFILYPNYPNPFNPTTIIKYSLPAGRQELPITSVVSLKIYDILGREVATLVNDFKTTGRYEVKFDASNLASGVYIYRLSAGDFNASHKMLLLK